MRRPKLRLPRFKRRTPESPVEQAAPAAVGTRITDDGVEGTKASVAWADLRSLEFECGGWDEGVWVEPWVWFHGPDGVFVTMRYEQLPKRAFGDLGRLPGFPLADFLQIESEQEIGKRIVVWERPALVAEG